MADAKSESIATKQRVEQLENCVILLTEKLEKTNQPPIQHDLIVQSTINENKGQMHDNKDLSSVQKRQVKTSQSVDTANSEKIIQARVEDKRPDGK